MTYVYEHNAYVAGHPVSIIKEGSPFHGSFGRIVKVNGDMCVVKVDGVFRSYSKSHLALCSAFAMPAVARNYSKFARRMGWGK